MPEPVCIVSVVEGVNQDIDEIRFHANGGTDGVSVVTLVLAGDGDTTCVVDPVKRNGWVVRTNVLGFTKVTRGE